MLITSYADMRNISIKLLSIAALFAAITIFSPSNGTAGEILLEGDCTDYKSDTVVSEIQVLIRELRRMDRKGSNYINQYPVIANLNNLMDPDNINSAEAINAFRCLDDVEVVQALIDIAGTDDFTIRVNASHVLVNIVDNTTVCAVINALYDERLNIDTAFNFWQVLKVVSKYARTENKEWIRKLIANRLPKMQFGDFSDTRGVINVIKTYLDKAQNISMKPKFEAEYYKCLDLYGDHIL